MECQVPHYRREHGQHEELDWRPRQWKERDVERLAERTHPNQNEERGDAEGQQVGILASEEPNEDEAEKYPDEQHGAGNLVVCNLPRRPRSDPNARDHGGHRRP